MAAFYGDPPPGWRTHAVAYVIAGGPDDGTALRTLARYLRAVADEFERAAVATDETA